MNHCGRGLNYLDAMRFHYGDNATFICGYEAVCLGFTLYHLLTDYNVKCVILAPMTMLKPSGQKKVITDKRDAALIARCQTYIETCRRNGINEMMALSRLCSGNPYTVEEFFFTA